METKTPCNVNISIRQRWVTCWMLPPPQKKKECLGTQRTGGWVDPTAGLDMVVKKKNLSLLGIYTLSISPNPGTLLSYPNTSHKLKGLIKICNFHTFRGFHSSDCSYCGLVGWWSLIGGYWLLKGTCSSIFRVEVCMVRNWLSETGKLQGSYRKNSVGFKEEFVTYLMIWLLSLLENVATVHCEGFV